MEEAKHEQPALKKNNWTVDREHGKKCSCKLCSNGRKVQTKLTNYYVVTNHALLLVGELRWLHIADRLAGMVKAKRGTPITYDLNHMPWKRFITVSKKSLGVDQPYPVVMIDFPWPEAANFGALKPNYRLMHEDDMLSIPLATIQQVGFLFLWVIRSRQEWGFAYAREHGYAHVDTIIWNKGTAHCAGAFRQGYETCMVFSKGAVDGVCYNQTQNIFYEKPGPSSQKPEFIYSMIDALLPNAGPKLELFGRQNNVREGWVTIGNQVHG